jgi:type I restriction enzyme S subunit
VEGLAYITSEQDAEMAGSRVRPEDLLLNITGASIGRACVVPAELCPANVNQHVAIIRCEGTMHPEYLSYYISTSWFQNYISDIQTGATRQALTKATIEDFPIPIPPLPEQQRIAAILRDQLEAVGHARQAVLARLHAANALVPALLRSVFESEEAKKWPRVLLREVCEFLAARSIRLDGDTPVMTVTTAALSETGFLGGGVKEARMRANDFTAAVLTAGEILVARSNTSELVGRVARYKGCPSGVVASDLTIRLRPVESSDGDFTTAYLSFLYLSAYWAERAGGTSSSMKKITRSHLASLPIPQPSLRIQHEVASDLSRQVEESAAISTACTTDLAIIDALPPSLLRRAFAGEL